MSGSWEPGRYHDTFQAKVRELVRARAAGEEIAAAEEPPTATNVIDLTEILQSSLDQARGTGPKSRQKKPAAGKAPQKAARSGGGKSELRQLSKAELYQRATDQDIAGRSKMSREQLIDALARAGRSRKKSAA
ncbi:hypothetical protein [Streptomyces albicerus]|uniref:hypothetical protein n=1 Tax=Streptomyces albicerus TaxID=2569859 RepID=UPI00124B5FEA|nr:hypothetical protein [Streptomyces albicerus]